MSKWNIIDFSFFKEIRYLETSKLNKLAAIIDHTNGFDDLLQCLMQPKNLESSLLHVEPLKLSLDSIDRMKQQVKCEKSPSLALIKYWSITGRRRPTVRILLLQLRNAKLQWAADYVTQTIMGLDPGLTDKHINQIQPLPKAIHGKQEYLINKEFMFESSDEIFKDIVVPIKRYSFRSIYESTNRFCHQPYDHDTGEGTRVGDGRFSSVFRATTHVEPDGLEMIVAAKLLKSGSNTQYLANEINLACKIEHKNILNLLGISLGEQLGSIRYFCLIYPYIVNGSLLRCLTKGLACGNKSHLDCEQRFSITRGIADGIAYLHNFQDKPIIHRDIKTANILIDSELNPKIGDFTLIRQLDSQSLGETQYSSNVIGTSIYMPPEAFQGGISVKFDIFSFGVVILEILTGMKPFDDNSSEDLLTFISDKLYDIECGPTQFVPESEDALLKFDLIQSGLPLKDQFLISILDKKAGHWNHTKAVKMFKLAQRATESRKRDRPDIIEVLEILENLEVA